jgi:hypothetical protein
MIFISFLVVYLGLLYVYAEVRNARLGRDVWDWAHKLSKWLKTKGY